MARGMVKAAALVAGIGALSLGVNQFFSFDLLGWGIGLIPTSTIPWANIVYGVVGVAGAYVVGDGLGIIK